MAKLQKDALIAEIIEACASPRGDPSVGGEDGDRRHLLSPWSIGGLSLPNRCVIAPLALIGGRLTPDAEVRRFYLSRSDAGLLTTGPIPASLGGGPLPVYGWCGLNETLHAKGGRIFLQIALDGCSAAKAICLAASAPAAAFDGVCLYARENVADVLRIVRAVREKLGRAYPILCRASLSPALAESGLTAPKAADVPTVSETLTLLTELAGAGVDAFEIGLGCPDTPWLLHPASQMPEACFAEAARALKAHFRCLGIRAGVAAFGRLGSPARCEALLEKGDCDLVSLDGAGISDPDWMKKLLEGRVGEIVPRPLPADALPTECEKLAVIGAGRRGMSYAIRAADAGCRVELFEAEERPGGKLALYRSAAAAEKKKELDYLLAEIGKRPRILLRGGTRADAEHLKKRRLRPRRVRLPAGGARRADGPGLGRDPLRAGGRA